VLPVYTLIIGLYINTGTHTHTCAALFTCTLHVHVNSISQYSSRQAKYSVAFRNGSNVSEYIFTVCKVYERIHEST